MKNILLKRDFSHFNLLSIEVHASIISTDLLEKIQNEQTKKEQTNKEIHINYAI